MPRRLKQTLKFTGYFLLSLTAFLLLYILSAYSLSRIAVDAEVVPTKDIAIYIKTNGVHTDIVVPLKTEQIDWSKEIRFADTQLKDSSQINYLAMGWGDKGFYLETPTWADLKFSTAFKAAFALSSTAMHTCFYKSMKESNSCKKIMISKEQYARLIDYINSSFQLNTGGKFMPIANAHYNDTDAFYEANGSYSLFHTCNTWANNGLKACGLRACLWTPFDTGIFLKYQ